MTALLENLDGDCDVTWPAVCLDKCQKKLPDDATPSPAACRAAGMDDACCVEAGLNRVPGYRAVYDPEAPQKCQVACEGPPAEKLAKEIGKPDMADPRYLRRLANWRDECYRGCSGSGGR